MEFKGFKDCFDFLLDEKLAVKNFVSDRHTTIAKHMRLNMNPIKHYFDLWHLKKSQYNKFLNTICFSLHMYLVVVLH